MIKLYRKKFKTNQIALTIVIILFYFIVNG